MALYVSPHRLPQEIFFGDARLNWLADPTEPGVWNAIEHWNRNHVVPIALSHEETHTFNIPLRHKLGGVPLNGLRHLINKPASGILAMQAIEMFEMDVLDAHEHPNAPPSTYRHSCLLHTAKVASALVDLGYVTVRPQSTSDTDGYYAHVPSASNNCGQNAAVFDTAH